ncbi:MAG: M23 family metallopeptidase [Bacteroidales bacterium]|nr:M23 family metallopeptidase [Bacteroidales bacterium]MCF8391021.1 M23 family metallopeptidase [Bacteroidales bacterium]
MRTKLHFDSEKLKFETLVYSPKEKMFRIMSFLLVSLLFAGFFYYLLDYKIGSMDARRMTSKQEDLLFRLKLMNTDIQYMEKKLEDLQYNDDQIYRTYFEVDPLSENLREAGFGGVDRYAVYKNSTFAPLLSEVDQSLDMVSKKLVVQSRSYDELLEMARTKEKRLLARPAIQPVSIKLLKRFGSAYGMRFHPILKVYKMHEGIDLTAPRGTPIFATADGIVLQAAATDGGYGNKILIDHGFGYKTLYGHCYKMYVKKGQRVKRGDVIGTVGSTGLSLSPHLHYEVHVNGRKVNPLNYYANDLSAEEYDHMIKLLSNADPNFDIN